MFALCVVLFLISLFATSEQCLKTLPPEEIYITSTEPLFETTTVNLCNDCDVDEIVQNTLTVDFALTVASVLVDSCIRVTAGCHSSENCETVMLFTESGGKTMPLKNPAGSVVIRLNCDRDGILYYDNLKIVDKISCVCID